MRRVTLVAVSAIFGVSLAWGQNAPVKVITPTKMDVSQPLRVMVKDAKSLNLPPGQEREIPNIFSSSKKDSKKPEGATPVIDPLWQPSQTTASTAAPTVNLNFDGASNNDNQIVIGGRVAPPDPNMDVGLNHIVQTINLVTTIYDKSGNILLGPFATDDLWSGFGGPCELNNDGDPIVVYDHLADRWLISQFVFSSDQCVCISQTPDPTGNYFRYRFSTPGNDYPKIGMMADGYYITIRNFSVGFSMDAGVMDRAKMLVGNSSAALQIFNLSALNPDVEGYQPADLDGPAPPAGTPGLIVGHNGGPTLVHNELEVYELDADFVTPSNSTLSLTSTIPVAQFDLVQSNIPQPSPGSSLDDLTNFTMYRVGFRDMGSHFAMVLNHTVDVNDFANHAGIRWYEIRDNTRTGGSWSLFQQGTHAPDASHRWMAGIAMNANGDIGLSYTVSSSSIFPSIRVAGRTASDPLGTLQSEVTVIAGTGAQTGTSRWGDYSSLSVDPADNTSFVGTHEYVKTTGSFNWWTRVFSFSLTPPTPTPPTITSTANTAATIGAAYSYDADNTVNVTGTAPITFSFTGPVGFNVHPTTGVVSWTPTATGTFPVSITATNAQGFDTQNFSINVSTYAARINAGGANYTDGGGDLFVADKAYTAGSFGFSGGTTNTFSNAIGNTTDDALYQSLRRSLGGAGLSFSYLFDVPSAGNYNVTLHLSAPAQGAGNFIMNVSAEGSTVFSNLDINSEAGGTFNALVKNFSTNVTDGTLNLTFTNVNKAALVCAIEVEAGTPPPPAPEIDVTPVAVNFGSVQVGQTADQTVTINNTGAATLTVSGLTITNSVFSLVSPPSVPFNIGAGGNQALTVRFTPTAAGTQNGNLAIASNDADEPTVNVALTGTGTTPPGPQTFRLNAGGPNFTTGGGNAFVADQAYSGGSFGFIGGTTASFGNAIGNTTDDALYQTIRRTSGSATTFSYDFDVAASGNYNVTLHLMAPALGSGSFIMNVVAEGVTVFSNLDINTEAGGTFNALVKNFSVTVTDGRLDLDFVRVNKAALVCAIEVVSGSAPGFAKNDAGASIASVPQEFQLHQNHPNPFNPSTDIRFEVPNAMEVQLTIYNTLGEVVRTLVRSHHEAGSYTVRWDGRLSSGARAPSGIYIYRLEGNGLSQVRKMTLLQ